jgi:hypothetical protein
VAASHSSSLLRTGASSPDALSGGFEQALWVLGAIALIALPASFVLVRRDVLADAVARTTTQPALGTSN